MIKKRELQDNKLDFIKVEIKCDRDMIISIDQRFTIYELGQVYIQDKKESTHSLT